MFGLMSCKFIKLNFHVLFRSHLKLQIEFVTIQIELKTRHLKLSIHDMLSNSSRRERMTCLKLGLKTCRQTILIVLGFLIQQ